MEQQNFSSPQQPDLTKLSPKDVKPFWLVILLVLAIALVGVVVWQKNNASQITDALQKQISSLQNQIANLQNKNSNPTGEIVATTSDETAGWKIYTNTEYGYAVKYPSDWVYDELTTPTKGEIVSFGKDKNSAGEVQIYSMSNSKGDKFLKDWWYNNEYKRLGNPSTYFSDIIQYADSGAGGSGLMIYWKNNSDSKYVYQATMNFSSSLNYVETFQRLSFYYQMLSTFKFTK